MGVFEIDVGGLTQADRALRKFGATVENWRPFWSQLGEKPGDRNTTALAVTPTIRTAPRVASLDRFATRPGRCFSSRVPIDSHSDRVFFI